MTCDNTNVYAEYEGAPLNAQIFDGDTEFQGSGEVCGLCSTGVTLSGVTGNTAQQVFLVLMSQDAAGLVNPLITCREAVIGLVDLSTPAREGNTCGDTPF